MARKAEDIESPIDDIEERQERQAEAKARKGLSLDETAFRDLNDFFTEESSFLDVFAHGSLA